RALQFLRQFDFPALGVGGGGGAGCAGRTDRDRRLADPPGDRAPLPSAADGVAPCEPGTIRSPLSARRRFPTAFRRRPGRIYWAASPSSVSAPPWWGSMAAGRRPCWRSSLGDWNSAG